MINALVVSNILLWVMVVVLAAVVLALLRQIGVLNERVAPAGALMTGGGPQVGDPAPIMRIADWSGELRTVGGSSADGMSTLLLFVSPTCPVCKTVLSIVASMLRTEHRWLRVMLASDGPRVEHEAFVRTHEFAAMPYLLSADLGLLYQVGKLPYAVLINADGIISAKGLVNTREHLESLFEAKERGVASLQEYLRNRHGSKQVA